METQTKYVFLLGLLYFFVGYLGICHHELWLDEAHHWLLARDSQSVAELLANTKDEGHPILWNFLLFLLTRFTPNPFAMQLLHLLIATAAMVIFLRKAPFSWWFKLLFLFGYFMIFEYALIARNYMLGVLFLFLACADLAARDKKFPWICVWLTLAANVHLMFAVIAFALFLTIALEQLQRQSASRNHLAIGVAVFVVGLVVAAVQIVPSAESAFFTPINEMPWNEKFTKGFVALFKGWLTVPDFRSLHFWNSNLLVGLSKPFSAGVGLLLYLVPLLLFFKKRKVLFFVYTALLGTQIFFFLTQRSATRHDGMTFLILIMALWMQAYFPTDESKSKVSTFADTVKMPIIYGILLLQFCSGIYAYAMDYRYAFTNEARVNWYLKEHHLDSQTIIASNCSGTVISPNLQKKLYFLCANDFGSFCRWNSGCASGFSIAQLDKMLLDYLKTHASGIYVSDTGRLEYSKGAVHYRLLQKFEGSIVRHNDYYLYEISKI